MDHSEIDDLFATASKEAAAVAAIDDAVSTLKQARAAKSQLASLDTANLRTALRRRTNTGESE